MITSKNSTQIQVIFKLILFLFITTKAVTIDVLVSTDGISKGTITVTCSNNPSQEPLKGLGVQFTVNSQLNLSSVQVKPPLNDRWSMAKPQLKRDHNKIDIMSISPFSVINKKDTTTRIFIASCKISGASITTLSYDEIVKNITIVDALDASTSPLQITPVIKYDGCVGTLAGDELRIQNPVIRKMGSSYSLAFKIDRKMSIRTYIINAQGKLVKLFPLKNYVRGFHTIRWDGSNQHNSPVAAGIYFIQIEIGNKTYNKKVSILR